MLGDCLFKPMERGRDGRSGDGGAVFADRGSAIHPGEQLAEQLEELQMSAAELSRQLKVPTNRITEILNGQRALTGDTALRLGHFFGTSAELWMNLQKLYELRLADQKAGDTIKALPTLAGRGNEQGGSQPRPL